MNAVAANEAVVRRLIDALQRRDVDALGAVLADDVVYHFPGRSAMAGRYRGRGAVLDFFRRFGALLGAPPTLTTHDLLASADHVVELGVNSAARDGQPFEWRVIRVYHVRDDRIAEIWVIVEDPYALDAYLA
jgi:uncharacterized protein